MCSFYPRTKLVQFNAMEYYQQAVGESTSLDEALDRLYSRIALLLIDSLDSVRGFPSLFKGDKDQAKFLYRWALRFPGGGLERFCSESSYVELIVESKLKKGII